ncbi:MAG: hypothetical protein IIA05_10905 [Proteobacteria bacterium]|nr:hypothetical protein [Pseudomonadota bacterium]
MEATSGKVENCGSDRYARRQPPSSPLIWAQGSALAEEWWQALEREIMQAHACDVHATRIVSDRETKRLHLFMVMVVCADKRTFTAIRLNEDPYFFERFGAGEVRACPKLE